MQVRQEQAEDWWEVEALYDLCFGPGREALSSYRLRDGVSPVAELSLIAVDQGSLAGAVRHWPVCVGSVRALLLGPIAVHPTHQGEGVGRALIETSLSKAQDLDWPRVILVGDGPYYARFGFQRLDRVKMPPPTNPDRVLGRGAWEGVCGTVTKFADR